MYRDQLGRLDQSCLPQKPHPAYYMQGILATSYQAIPTSMVVRNVSSTVYF